MKSVIKAVRIAHASGSLSDAAVGDRVCSGDTVKTGADSRATVVMNDGNVSNLSPDSSLVVEAYGKKKVSLGVLSGKMRASVPKQNKYDEKQNTFKVKTRAAVAGVRGTDFVTSFDPANGKSSVVAFSGRVDVGALGPDGSILNSVSIGPGQMTETALGGAPSPPKTVPAAELRQLNSATSTPSPTASTSPPASPKTATSNAPATNTLTTPAAGASAAASPQRLSMVEPVDSSGAAPMRDPALPPPLASIPPALVPNAPVLPPLPPTNDFINQQVLGSGPSQVHVNVHF